MIALSDRSVFLGVLFSFVLATSTALAQSLPMPSPTPSEPEAVLEPTSASSQAKLVVSIEYRDREPVAGPLGTNGLRDFRVPPYLSDWKIDITFSDESVEYLYLARITFDAAALASNQAASGILENQLTRVIADIKSHQPNAEIIGVDATAIAGSTSQNASQAPATLQRREKSSGKIEYRLLGSIYSGRELLCYYSTSWFESDQEREQVMHSLSKLGIEPQFHHTKLGER